MPSLIHLLTPNRPTLSTVVCGDPSASTATWTRALVTCPRCLGQNEELRITNVERGEEPSYNSQFVIRNSQFSPERSACTCGPGVTPCPTCRAFRVTHRADGSPRQAQRFRTEAAFQEAIRQACVQGAWRSYHTYRSLHSAPGFPDLVAVRGDRMVVAELKMPGKRPTPAQQHWLDALGQVRVVKTFLWYPADLATILEVLQ